MRLVFAAWLLLLSAGAGASPRAPVAAEVEAVKQGNGWTARFHFLRRARAWVFVHSALTRVGGHSWRIPTWTVETPGVRLERHGHYDVLVAVDGGPVPARVRVRFTPCAEDLVAAYDPALVFTDGSVALYSQQFDAFPYDGAAAAGRLPVDLAASAVRRTRTAVTYRDVGGAVLHAGRRLPSVTLSENEDEGTYVLFGPARPIVTADMAAIIDPALPAWIADTLRRGVPDIFRRYSAVLGPAPGPKPTIMVSWSGPTPGMSSMGGSVLPGLITMDYEGARVAEESAAGAGHGLWFIAHEAAHFWLGNAVRYEFSRDAWIMEGGADLLAFRMVASIDPRYDWRGELNKSIADCVAFSTNKGVASAEERGEQRAYYACGAVFGLVAEAASHRPFVQFVKLIVDANRADGVVTRREWLATLDQVSRDPTLGRDIGVMLDRGAADPKAAIASLFTRAGIAFTAGPDGMPRLR